MTMFWQDNFKGTDELEDELSVLQKELRSKFVDEWMFDEDPLKACIRIGFKPSFAHTYSSQFMEESYVLNLIKERKQALIKSETVNEDDEALVINALREACKHGPYASRVAAAGRLAVIRGLDAPAKMEQTLAMKGGVMVLAPDTSTAAWEAQAAASQQALVQDTQA